VIPPESQPSDGFSSADFGKTPLHEDSADF
jgi:hypothetical protein